jgi:hypothetical protein
MTPETRLRVERAIIELSDIDQALSLMASGLRSRVATALGQLTAVREAFETRAAEARAAIVEQAESDARTESDEPGTAREWFDSWLADYSGEHEIEPFTEDEAFAIYEQAFNRARGGAS